MSFGPFAIGPKFKPPTTELERENELQSMSPTDAIKRAEMIKHYRNLFQKLKKNEQTIPGVELNYAQKQALMNAVAVELNQLINGDVDKRVNSDFVRDFQEWLLGRSRYNANTDKTPWGAKRLVGDSIMAYLNSFVDKKFELQKALSKLKMNIPDDIQTAWLYYKFIVRGMDPDGCEFLPEYEWLTSQTGIDKAKAAEKFTGDVWDAQTEKTKWDSASVIRDGPQNAGIVPPRVDEKTLEVPPQTQPELEIPMKEEEPPVPPPVPPPGPPPAPAPDQPQASIERGTEMDVEKENEVEIEKKRVAELEEKLKTASEAEKKRLLEMEEKMKTLEIEKKNLAEMKIPELMKQLDQANREIDARNQAIQSLMSEKGSLTEEAKNRILAVMSESLEKEKKYSTVVMELESRMRALEGDILKKSESIKGLETIVAGKKHAKREIKQRATTEIQKSKADFEKLQQEVVVARVQMEKQKSDLSEFQKQMQTKGGESEELKKVLAEREKEMESMKAMLEKAILESRKFQQTYQTDVTELQEKLKGKEAHIQHLQETEQRYLGESQKLAAENKELQKNLQSSHKTLDQMNKQIEEMKKDLGEAKKGREGDTQQLQIWLTQIQQEKMALEEKIKAQEQELAKTRQRQAALSEGETYAMEGRKKRRMSKEQTPEVTPFTLEPEPMASFPMAEAPPGGFEGTGRRLEYLPKEYQKYATKWFTDDQIKDMDDDQLVKVMQYNPSHHVVWKATNERRRRNNLEPLSFSQVTPYVPKPYETSIPSQMKIKATVDYTKEEIKSMTPDQRMELIEKTMIFDVEKRAMEAMSNEELKDFIFKTQDKNLEMRAQKVLGSRKKK